MRSLQCSLALVFLLTVAPLTLLLAEAVIARGSGGPAADYRNPPVEPERLGNRGSPLIYVVLGDSTAAGQGAPYAQGIARTTAQQLANGRSIQLFNFARSGARIHDVLREQLPLLRGLSPDLVLVSAGSNDVTALARLSEIESSLQQLIDGLTLINPNVRCVLTGAGDLGAIPRLPQPLRWIAGLRAQQVNRVFQAAVERNGLTFAPVAEQTGPAFAHHPELFGEDRFHPNAEGYVLWTSVLVPSLEKALARPPAVHQPP